MEGSKSQLKFRNYLSISGAPARGDVESYSGGGRYDHFLRDAMMERQLEKERIRREILAEEAERRRELEAEVRRELREERELELRRRGGDRWEDLRRNCYVERRSFEKRVALPVEERMYDFPRLEEGRIVRDRMYDFPPLGEGKTRGYEKEELPFQRATRGYEKEELPFQRATRGYDKEELPFQRAPQVIKSEAKPPSDALNALKAEDKKQIISLERMYDFPRLEGKIGDYEKEELPFQRAPQPIKLEVKSPSDVFKEGKQIISSESIYDSPRLEGKIGGYEKEELPFQRAPQPIKTEVKSPSEVFKEGKQIISSAKPDANHRGKKRKDMASPVEGPNEVTKKLTKEWSCALCQICATSEQALEDHLQGKKHKSKQAGPKAGMIGICSKMINNTLNPSQVGERNVEVENFQQISNKNESGVENNKIAIVMENECGGAVQNMPKNKKNRFKFYCKMCEVGAFCKEVMDDHKKGKKHLLSLHKLGAKS